MTVPGVGKLQGSNRPTQWTGRDVYSFFGIPFGETTAGEHRFAPPRPKGPLNDGKVCSMLEFSKNLNITVLSGCI